MNTNISNFYIKDYLNSSHDITWSFQYNLSGSNFTDGGFTTFLATKESTGNSGGGGASLGIGPKGIIPKVDNIILCVAIDSTGLFGTKTTFSTGLDNPIPNSMIIRINNELTFLTAFPLSSVHLQGLSSNNKFETLRFNFTNIGKTLNIARLNEFNEYINFYSYTTNFKIKTSTPLKIGFSHASPINIIKLKPKLTLKDIHVQGRLSNPKFTKSIINDQNFINSLTEDEYLEYLEFLSYLNLDYFFYSACHLVV